MCNDKNPFSNVYIPNSEQTTEKEAERNNNIEDTADKFLKDVKPNKPSRIVIRAKIV